MNRLIKELPRAIFISISIFIVLLIIRMMTGVKIELNNGLLINFGYSMLYGLSLYYANALVFIYLDKIFKTERFTQKRILIGFLSSFFISVFVIFLLRIFEDVIIENKTLIEFLSK